MAVMVRHYLHIEPSADLDELTRQHAEATWIEERLQIMMTNAVAKGMGGQ